MTQAQPSFSADPLFVELAGVGLRHVFELEAFAERVFVVGSSRQADVRLDGAGIAAAEFHIERVGDAAWITPAYRGRGLRVNGALTQDRVEVSTRLLLQLGTWDLELKVLVNASDTEPSTRSSSAPQPLPGDYFESVPTDTAATRVALQPVDPRNHLAATTRIPVTQPPMFALPEQQTERLAPPAAPMFPLPQQTQRVPRLEATTPPFQAAPVALLQTVRLEPVVEVPRPLTPSAPPVAATPPTESTPQLTPHTPPSSLLTQDTTSFDVAALHVAPGSTPVPATAPDTRASSDLPAATAVMTRPPVVETWKTLLTQLGITTRQRPVLVLGGALAASLVLALALVGATRLPAPTTAKAAPRTTPSASVARLATSPPAVVPALPRQPSMVVVAPGPAAEKPAAGPRSAKPPETPLLIAVRHASAGRLAEAAETYRALASGPDAAVYATLAAVLARRATAACANAAAQDQACPELLK